MSQDAVVSYTSVESVIVTILALIVIAIFVGALYSFFHAIFLFIFSKGDVEKNKSAWNGIRFMMMGVIFTVILLLFFPTLLRYMQVKSYEVYEAKNIFKRVGEIIDSAMDFGKDITNSQKGQINPGYKTNSNSVSDYSL